MYDGYNVQAGPSEIQLPRQYTNAEQNWQQAYVKVLEEPVSHAYRFRYGSEGRTAGSIPGVLSTPEIKTFPTIKVEGYVGKAIVIVSCVTKDPPYRAHPHIIVGREGCKMGVCTLPIPPETMTVQFSNIGIQYVKKKEIEKELMIREHIGVDPFGCGFAHSKQKNTLDLTAVRLCFQVMLKGPSGKYCIRLDPVVSQVINHTKSASILNIIKLSHCVSPVDGGREDIILVCDEVDKNDIAVRFFKKQDDLIVWESQVNVEPCQVYKKHVLWFRAPKYRTVEIEEPIDVSIQLMRPSSKATGPPLPFYMVPTPNLGRISLKKRKISLFEPNNFNNTSLLPETLEVPLTSPQITFPNDGSSSPSSQSYNFDKPSTHRNKPFNLPSPENSNSSSTYQMPQVPLNTYNPRISPALPFLLENSCSNNMLQVPQNMDTASTSLDGIPRYPSYLESPGSSSQMPQATQGSKTHLNASGYAHYGTPNQRQTDNVNSSLFELDPSQMNSGELMRELGIDQLNEIEKLSLSESFLTDM